MILDVRAVKFINQSSWFEPRVVEGQIVQVGMVMDEYFDYGGRVIHTEVRETGVVFGYD